MREPLWIPKEFRSPAALAGMPEDTPILVGFSGGADSVSLLHMLAKRAKETGGRVYALHVNHGIRGAEADRDEAFCRRFADSLGVSLFVRRVSVPDLAKERKESVETAARQIRYECFEEIMKRESIPLLVTAHNADDNLETMLFHMIRGAGLRGMCGIPVCRRFGEGSLCRPLLGMTRRSILAYCQKEGLSYVTDSTNTHTDYTRNRIRSEVLPALVAIHGGAVENAARLSEHLRADELCLESMTDWFLDDLSEDGSLELEKINGSPDAIVNRALMALYSHLSEGGDLSHAHLTALRQLCREGRPHSAVSLPRGMEGVIEDGRLFFRIKQPRALAEPYCIPLREGENRISQTNTEIVMGNSQKTINIYKKSILLSIDSAKINGALTARNRQEGDRIRLGGMSRSVKKLMCDKKIPVAIRSRLPILCDEDGVVAVPLLGVRDGASADSREESVLTLRIDLL